MTSPLRPSNGIQAIIRITIEVQNGIEQTSSSTICVARLRTRKARKYAIKKPSVTVMTQVIAQNSRVVR